MIEVPLYRHSHVSYYQARTLRCATLELHPSLKTFSNGAFVWNPDLDTLNEEPILTGVQGYIADEKQPPPRTLR